MKLLYFPFIECWDGEKMGETTAEQDNIWIIPHGYCHPS